VIVARAIRLYVDEHGEPDLEVSRPVAEVRRELAAIVDGRINPDAMLPWLGGARFRAAMSDHGPALSVAR
jgi:hypothetical protein